MKLHLSLAMVCAAALFNGSIPASAQSYPSQPVRIVVPFTAGGGVDVLARITGQRVQQVVGQPFIIENRPGAGGSLGLSYVAKSPPDGYTLVLIANSLTINPAINPAVPYDAAKDFAPISILAWGTVVLGGIPAAPFGSIPELIAYAKQNPGKVTYASAGIGTPNHFAVEIFASVAGIKLTHIPYKGNSQAVTDVLNGQVNFFSTSIPTIQSLWKAGKLKLYGVATAKRSTILPDVPGMAEFGLADADFQGFIGLLAPAGTPAGVVGRLNSTFNAVLREPEIQTKLAGNFQPAGTTPEEFAAVIKRDLNVLTKIAKAAGIKEE